LQCKHEFSSLQHGPSDQPPTSQPFPQTFLNSPAVNSSKRLLKEMPPAPDSKRLRPSGAETPPLARDLLPKPQSGNASSPWSPMDSLSLRATRQKKRGRPSKADVERRQREAIERGEIITESAEIIQPTPEKWAPTELLAQDNSSLDSPPITILPTAPVHSPRSDRTPVYNMLPNLSEEMSPPEVMKREKSESPNKPKVMHPTRCRGFQY
jgi:hypothetical protein